MSKVITFHYTLTDKSGKHLDSSHERKDPMMFMVGSGQIIPGLEKQIKDLAKGEKKKIHVVASEAYGDVEEELVMSISRDRFPKDHIFKIGDQFQAKTEHGPGPVFTVVEIMDTTVKVDGNHPLAGHDLVFDIEIIDTRAATQEELSHGHAHGPGGHHH